MREELNFKFCEIKVREHPLVVVIFKSVFITKSRIEVKFVSVENIVCADNIE